MCGQATSRCQRVTGGVITAITVQICLLPLECHSRRTRPASPTWSGGDTSAQTLHEHEQSRKAEQYVTMQVSLLLLLHGRAAVEARQLHCLGSQRNTSWPLSPETPYMRGSCSGSVAFSWATDEPARHRVKG